MDLYVRYTVEFEIANWFSTWEQLNQAANQQFVWVLREYIPNLSIHGCYSRPGQPVTRPAMALRCDADLTAYRSSMQQGEAIYEIHLPESAVEMVAAYYKTTIENNQLQITRLTEQITNLRHQGQGLQQGFMLLQQVAPAQDVQIVTIVTNYNQGIVPIVTAMTGSAEDHWTNQQGVRVLAFWGAQSPQHVQEIYHTNGFEAVIAAMKQFPGDVMIQQYGCHLFAVAAPAAEYRSEILRLAGIEPIITAMIQHRGEPTVQQYGCWALSTLALSPEICSQIVELNGIQPIVIAIQTFPADATVVRYALSALKPIVTTEENVLQLVKFEGIPALIAVLNHFQQDAQVTTYCITTLAEMAKTESGRVQFGQAGVIPVILTTMKNYVRDVQIQECGLTCLAALAGSEANQTIIFKCDGIPYVINAIRSAYGTDEEHVSLIYAGVCLICNLSTHRECQPQIVQYKGCECVIEVMQKYPDNAGLHDQCLKLISRVAVYQQALHALIASGGVDTVLRSMRTHADSVEVQVHGCYAIGMLATSEDAKVHMGKSGAVLLLVKDMHDFPGEKHIHEQAAAALTILCEHESNVLSFASTILGEEDAQVSATVVLNHSVMSWYQEDQVVRQTLKLMGLLAAVDDAMRAQLLAGPPGGLEVAVNAINENLQSDVVCYYGLKAVASIAYPQPPPEYGLFCAGLIDIVVTAMKTHMRQEDNRVQEAGCEVLSVLALMEELQDALLQKGVVPVLCAASKGWMNDTLIQRKACRAFANLAEYSDMCDEIREKGGIACIIESMRYHVGHPEVGEQGCAALANLALNEQNRLEVARMDGVKAVLAGLRQHAHPGIQAYGLGALGNLAVEESNLTVILKNGALQMVINAMTKWPDDARVQHFACLAISNFAHDDENKVAFGKLGGNKLVIAAMQRHPDHQGVQEQACGALANLGIHATNMTEIASLQGIELVIMGIKRNPHHKGVQENGCFALSKFLAMPNEDYRRRMISAGAQAALEGIRDCDPPPDFDVRICVNVLLRRLAEEFKAEDGAPTPAAGGAPPRAAAAIMGAPRPVMQQQAPPRPQMGGPRAPMVGKQMPMMGPAANWHGQQVMRPGMPMQGMQGMPMQMQQMQMRPGMPMQRPPGPGMMMQPGMQMRPQGMMMQGQPMMQGQMMRPQGYGMR